MEATSGGTLEIDGITIEQQGRRITANGGTVELVSGAVVEGGTLNQLEQRDIGDGVGPECNPEREHARRADDQRRQHLYDDGQQLDHRHSGHDHRQGHAPGERRQ